MAMLRRAAEIVHQPKVIPLLSSPSCFSVAIHSKATKHQNEITHFENSVRDRCKSGTLSLDEAKGLFNKGIEMKPTPDIFPFNELLGAIVKMKHYSSVFPLFNSMESTRINPDIGTFNILINCYCRVGKVRLGFAAFGRLLRRGLTPDHVTVNTLLKGLCMGGRKMKQKAKDFFDIIVDNGYLCNEFTYGIIIDRLCKAGDATTALELMKKMNDDRRLKPDLAIYTTIINGLCNSNQVDEALDIFYTMGIKPKVVTYISLIEGLCNSSQSQKAKGLLDEMVNVGISPDEATFNIVLAGFVRDNDTKNAMELLGVMVEKGFSPHKSSKSMLKALLVALLVDSEPNKENLKMVRNLLK